MELSEDEFEDGAESKQNPLAMTMYHQPSTEAAYEKVPTLLIDPGTLLSNVVNSGSATSAPKVVSSEVASTSAPTSLLLDTLNELKKDNEAIHEHLHKQDETNKEIRSWMLKQEDSSNEIKNLLLSLVSRRS